ncbi:hypothetical protein LJK87_38380 [Paenibacillus sp. P25]|nr:hypothetical protein LJK87_38380 [Paenibacillus sp. P25]
MRADPEEEAPAPFPWAWGWAAPGAGAGTRHDAEGSRQRYPRLPAPAVPLPGPAIRVGLIGVVLLTLLSSGAAPLGPYLLGISIDRYVIPRDGAGLMRLCLLLLAVYAFSAAATWVQAYVMAGVAQRTVRRTCGATCSPGCSGRL